MTKCAMLYGGGSGVNPDGTLGTEVEAGTILPFAGATPPQGYLLCNGQAVSRTIYAKLFTAIGTTYGTGNGTTTFNVPDLRKKFITGSQATTGYNLSNTGGSETVTLTTAQMPSHTHTTNSAGTHTHWFHFENGGNESSNFIGSQFSGDPNQGRGNGNNGSILSWVSLTSSGAHTHTLSSTGSGTAHENRPPRHIWHLTISLLQDCTVRVVNNIALVLIFSS